MTVDDVFGREHVTPVSVRPNDFDWSLLLNNSVYLTLLEVGRWDWSISQGLDFRHGRLVGVVVRLEIDYIKPLFWDPLARLQVRTRGEKIERYSFYLQQRVEDSSGELIADARLRLALFDKEQGKPVAIKLEEIRRLTKG
jgi:YbgC/YbaW family acyl-CoA thioester hydrolase